MSFNWSDLDWGAIAGAIAKNVSFGDNKKGSVDWKQLERLMDIDTERNRFDRQGIFTGWDWDTDENGNWSQNQTVNPNLVPGVERLMGRASSGIGLDPYSSPEAFDALMGAKTHNQMARHGLDPNAVFGSGGQQPQPQQQYPSYQGPRTQEFRDSNRNGVDDRDEAPGRDVGGMGGREGQAPGVDPRKLIMQGGMNNRPGSNSSNLGNQSDRGRTGWDWFDNSGWNPAAWGDNYNASAVEKLFGRNDIGSLGGMEAPGRVAQVLATLFGLPGGNMAGNVANDMFAYDPDKTYMSPVDPYDPYGMQNVPAQADQNLPNSNNDTYVDSVRTGAREGSNAGLTGPIRGFDNGFGMYNNRGGYGSGILGGNWGTGGSWGGGASGGQQTIKNGWYLLDQH